MMMLLFVATSISAIPIDFHELQLQSQETFGGHLSQHWQYDWQ